jgi:hypothetical protein
MGFCRLIKYYCINVFKAKKPLGEGVAENVRSHVA